jgi:ABC transporter, ATP-binding protein
LGAYLVSYAYGEKSDKEIIGYFPLLLLLIVCKGIFSYLHMLICHKLAYLILERLRLDIYNAVERATPLDASYRTGDISSIAMEDVETLETFFAHILGDYIIAAVCAVAYLTAYFFISPEAAFLSLVANILILSVPYLFANINAKRGKLLREELGKTNAGVVDTIQGIKEIIIFGSEQKFIDKVSKDTMNLNRIEIEDGKIKGIQAALINLFMSAVLIGAILIGHSQVLANKLNANYISILIVMALNIFLPVMSVSQIAGRLNLVVAAADRIWKLLSEKSQVDTSKKDFPNKDTKSYICVDNIFFSYGKGANVLKGVSLSVNKGENIVITGGSGEGKTTFVNLLMRFYDVDDGNIYINGENIRNMPPEKVREFIASVPQDTYLFRGTIMENIKLGNPNASDKEVRMAAHTALADTFIEELPKGYDSFVGERGLTLSGGEKQRIAIARALVKGSPILIMDEAVSNLDSENERLFREALKNLRKEKTVITIAHRKSTILEADRVVVLSKGKISFDKSVDEWSKMNS